MLGVIGFGCYARARARDCSAWFLRFSVIYHFNRHGNWLAVDSVEHGLGGGYSGFLAFGGLGEAVELGDEVFADRLFGGCLSGVGPERGTLPGALGRSPMTRTFGRSAPSVASAESRASRAAPPDPARGFERLPLPAMRRRGVHGGMIPHMRARMERASCVIGIDISAPFPRLNVSDKGRIGPIWCSGGQVWDVGYVGKCGVALPLAAAPTRVHPRVRPRTPRTPHACTRVPPRLRGHFLPHISPHTPHSLIWLAFLMSRGRRHCARV